MPQRESVRRTELFLRVKYPHITTRIFERAPDDHVIVVPADQLDATEHQEEFEREIRQASDFVTLLNSVPDGAVEIAVLGDNELGENLSGVPLTVADLSVIIAGKFPFAPNLANARPATSDVLNIDFAEPLAVEDEPLIREFLEKQFIGYSIVLGVQNPEVKRSAGTKLQSDTLDVKSIRERTHLPSFIASDEQWWFDNLGGLFEGSIPPSSFDVTKNAGFSCYIHGASFPNIDLRQALLAYDTIFLEPPFAEGRDEHVFWKSQDIGPRDLLRLVEAGRLRLVYSQPEERSDVGFLREAYEANPAGVFSRRKLAGLLIADIVEAANEYTLGRAELQESLRIATVALAAELNQPIQELARDFMYPSYLRRAALVPVLKRGGMGLSGLNQGSIFAELYKREHGKEVLIEGDMFGQAVHIAHALNATYIPHGPHAEYVQSWIEPMRLFGDRLNFYRSFNTRIAAAWAVNERRKAEERAIVLPPVPVVRFNKWASIDHILEYTSWPSDRRKARSLIGRLADLPEGERLTESERLQQELFEFDIAQDRRQKTIQWLDSGSGLVAYAIGLNLPPFFAGSFLLSQLLQAARKLPKMDRLIDAIESVISPASQPNEDLHLLSKISRVATLRE